MDFSLRNPETGQINTWVWIVAAGFGVIVLIMFAGGRGSSSSSGGSSGVSDAGGISSEYTDDLTAIQGALLELLQNQEDLGKGVLRPNKPTSTPKKGFIWWYSTQSNKWIERKVPKKPTEKPGKGREWAFSVNSWKWYKKQLAFGGVFLGPATVGEIGQEQVFGIGIVKPSYPTPMQKIGTSNIPGA